MKRGGEEHVKVKRLARELKINRAWAMGICEALWHATARLTPRGDIGKLTDFEIAKEVFWVNFEGSRGERRSSFLVSCLVNSGLVERCPINRLVIHDWKDHADQSVKKFLSRHGLDFVNPLSSQSPPSHSQQPLPLPLPAAAASGQAAASPPARPNGGEPLGPAAGSQNAALARLTADEVCAMVLRQMDAEGLLPPRYLRSEYGREEPNPVTQRIESALRRAMDRIRTARSPSRLARKIVLDELQEAS